MYDNLRQKQIILQSRMLDLITLAVNSAISFVEKGENIPDDVKQLIMQFAPKPKNDTFLTREPDDYGIPYIDRMSLEAAAELQRAKAREIVLSWGPEQQPPMIEGKADINIDMIHNEARARR